MDALSKVLESLVDYPAHFQLHCRWRRFKKRGQEISLEFYSFSYIGNGVFYNVSCKLPRHIEAP